MQPISKAVFKRLTKVPRLQEAYNTVNGYGGNRIQMEEKIPDSAGAWSRSTLTQKLRFTLAATTDQTH